MKVSSIELLPDVRKVPASHGAGVKRGDGRKKGTPHSISSREHQGNAIRPAAHQDSVSRERHTTSAVTHLSVRSCLEAMILSCVCASVSPAYCGSCFTVTLYFCRIVVMATIVSSSENLTRESYPVEEKKKKWLLEAYRRPIQDRAPPLNGKNASRGQSSSKKRDGLNR